MITVFGAKNKKCIVQGCKRPWFRVMPWKTGIELTHCPKHRLELQQKEADDIILSRQIEDALIMEKY